MKLRILVFLWPIKESRLSKKSILGGLLAIGDTHVSVNETSSTIHFVGQLQPTHTLSFVVKKVIIKKPTVKLRKSRVKFRKCIFQVTILTYRLLLSYILSLGYILCKLNNLSLLPQFIEWLEIYLEADIYLSNVCIKGLTRRQVVHTWALLLRKQLHSSRGPIAFIETRLDVIRAYNIQFTCSSTKSLSRWLPNGIPRAQIGPPVRLTQPKASNTSNCIL